jgi:hypothetical protein
MCVFVSSAVEHAAEYDLIEHSGLDVESNDPAHVLIHDDQNPVGPDVADSHLNRSILQRLSFRGPIKVSQDGPTASSLGR